jgi:hypothetical protein
MIVVMLVVRVMMLVLVMMVMTMLTSWWFMFWLEHDFNVMGHVAEKNFHFAFSINNQFAVVLC